MRATTILLIDAAESPGSLLIANTAKDEQFQITRKVDLPRGLAALKESRFDVVLLSLSLPDCRARESTAITLKAAGNIPVIVLVNDGETIKALEALSMGAYGYVVEDCRCHPLTQMIRHAMVQTQNIVDKDYARPRSPDNEEQLTTLATKFHKLRNALACIRQFGCILNDGLAGTLSDEQRDYITIMLENASKIRKVLDEVADETAESLGETTDNLGHLSKVGK
jgi:DNA-binding NtrC family response regulator